MNQVFDNSAQLNDSLLYPVEDAVVNAVGWLTLGIEVVGALVIAVGVLVAVSLLIKILLGRNDEDFRSVRLTLARYLSLALEFQLGADILSTAVAPSWDQIGMLAAIVVIRTTLNYFLMHEISLERKARNEPSHTAPG